MIVAFHWVRVRVRVGVRVFKEYANHMPEAFTEAFVAVIFFHGSYRGSFHGRFLLKLPWKKMVIYYSNLLLTSTEASVKASVEANLLPRKLP